MPGTSRSWIRSCRVPGLICRHVSQSKAKMFVISWRWQRGYPRCSPGADSRTACASLLVCACMLSLRGFRAGSQGDAASYCLTTMNLQPCSTSLLCFANKVNARFIWVPGDRTTLIIVTLTWAPLSNSVPEESRVKAFLAAISFRGVSVEQGSPNVLRLILKFLNWAEFKCFYFAGKTVKPPYHYFKRGIMANWAL